MRNEFSTPFHGESTLPWALKTRGDKMADTKYQKITNLAIIGVCGLGMLTLIAFLAHVGPFSVAPAGQAVVTAAGMWA